MKRIILIILFAFTTLGAQTISGYFTEYGKGEVKYFNQKGYIVGLTASLRTGPAAGDTSKYIASVPFGTSATNIRDISNKKIFVGIQIDVAFANVSATLISEISGDNTNWVTFSTISSNTSPNLTGVRWYLLDLTNVYTPYLRLKFNASGLKINNAGYIKFLYAIPL